MKFIIKTIILNCSIFSYRSKRAHSYTFCVYRLYILHLCGKIINFFKKNINKNKKL